MEGKIVSEIINKLRQQKAEIERTLKAQQAEFDRKIKEAEKAERATVIKNVRALIVQYNLTEKELNIVKNNTNEMSQLAKTNSVPLPILYKDEQGNKWTGRGKLPGWLVKAEAEGHNREEFAVKSGVDDQSATGPQAS